MCIHVSTLSLSDILFLNEYSTWDLFICENLSCIFSLAYSSSLSPSFGMVLTQGHGQLMVLGNVSVEEGKCVCVCVWSVCAW